MKRRQSLATHFRLVWHACAYSRYTYAHLHVRTYACICNQKLSHTSVQCSCTLVKALQVYRWLGTGRMHAHITPLHEQLGHVTRGDIHGHVCYFVILTL